jgi:hypothetical protein
MNPRKPKLDWIKKVLADPVGETRLRVVCGPEPAQSDCRSTDDPLGQFGAQDHSGAELGRTSTNI